MTKPIVWTVSDLDLLQFKIKAVLNPAKQKQLKHIPFVPGPYDIIWNGQPDTFTREWAAANVPSTHRYHGLLLAHVGDLLIGYVSLNWINHMINRPDRRLINAYSVFLPEKKGGGYGESFSDISSLDRKSFDQEADLDAAKAYVEAPWKLITSKTS